jgi:hypothetical protein
MEGEAARMGLLDESEDRFRRLELEAERAEPPTDSSKCLEVEFS